MTNRSYRDVCVARSPLLITVSLFWYDGEKPLVAKKRVKHLDYPVGVVTESVEKAIKVLMRGGSNVHNEMDMTVEQWIDFDQSPDLFDLIADAEEPEQAFVSRYVLEG